MGTMPKIEITKGTETPKLDAFVQALASPTAQSNADISEQYKAIEQECSTPEGLTKFQNAINKQF